MNEKLQYATMLEIPVNTCNVTYKPARRSRPGKKKPKDPEKVKEALMRKVNEEEGAAEENYPAAAEDALPQEQLPVPAEDQPTVNITEVKRKRPFKVTVVAVQLAIIGALVAAIFLTNAFYADSGINVFIRNVFGGKEEVVADTRGYEEFSPMLSLGGGASLNADGGVITFAGKGSVYSPCDGKVASVTVGEDGKITLEIKHSENFGTVISGLDFAYVAEGDAVFGNVPVGYFKEDGASMCFCDGDGAVITDYRIEDNSVVWAV